MFKKNCIFLLLLFSIKAIASYPIEHIDTVQKLVTTKKVDGENFEKGERFTLTFTDKTECTLKFEKSDEDSSYFWANSCEVTKISIGMFLEPSEIPTIDEFQSEKWFLTFNGGVSILFPTSDISSRFEGKKIGFSGEFGVYWPVFFSGLIVGLAGDFYSADNGTSEGELSFSSGGNYLSTIYFLKRELGHGLFGRLDVGSRFHDFLFFPVDASESLERRFSRSLSLRMGAGWSLHAFKNSHLVSQALLVIGPSEGLDVTTLQLLFGWIW